MFFYFKSYLISFKKTNFFLYKKYKIKSYKKILYWKNIFHIE